MRKLLAAATIAISLTAPTMSAAEYPSHAITFIVPFAAGGPTDTVARTVAASMSKSVGQPIIIENVAGAGGGVGVGRAALALPDGYTVSVSEHTRYQRRNVRAALRFGKRL